LSSIFKSLLILISLLQSIDKIEFLKGYITKNY